MSLHGVNLSLGRRANNGVSPLPRPTGYVEHPQLVGHVPPAGLQFPTKHVDIILKKKREREIFALLRYGMRPRLNKHAEKLLHAVIKVKEKAKV